uniref:Uncharacterized protein n=1 Tax=Rhizophora mucronata TaxID=61149 RepID=A0A2P2JJ48_RHIMU
MILYWLFQFLLKSCPCSLVLLSRPIRLQFLLLTTCTRLVWILIEHITNYYRVVEGCRFMGKVCMHDCI